MSLLSLLLSAYRVENYLKDKCLCDTNFISYSVWVWT